MNTWIEQGNEWYLKTDYGYEQKIIEKVFNNNLPPIGTVRMINRKLYYLKNIIQEFARYQKILEWYPINQQTNEGA